MRKVQMTDRDMSRKIDHWKVSIRDQKGSREVIVRGVSQWAAMMAAAYKWHIPWTMIIAGCTIKKIEMEEENTNVSV